MICSDAEPFWLREFRRWDAENQTSTDMFTRLPQETRQREASSVIAKTVTYVDAW